MSFKKKFFKTFAFLAILSPFAKYATSCVFNYDLVVFNWGEYIDIDALYGFEDTYNVKVKYLTFDSNETMIQKISGGTRYDVVFPSDYAVEEMAKKDLIEELDFSKFTNYWIGEKEDKGKFLVDILDKALVNLKETGTCVKSSDQTLVSCTKEEFDSGYPSIYSEFKEGFDLLKYAVPYTFGQTGILYNKEKIDKSELEQLGYRALMTDKNKDGSTREVVVYDAGKDVFAMALLATGHDIQYRDPQGIKDGTNFLKELIDKKKGHFAYKADEILDDIPNELYDIAFTYSGDAIYCIDVTTDEEGYSKWDFYIPPAQENAPTRTNIYTDCMVIMKDSPNKDLAYKFVDYMSSHDASYLNTTYIGYTTTRNDVYQEITDQDTESPCTAHDTEELKDFEQHQRGYFNYIPAYNLFPVYSDNITDKFYRYDEDYKQEVEKIWYDVVLSAV